MVNSTMSFVKKKLKPSDLLFHPDDTFKITMNVIGVILIFMEIMGIPM
jgi:hypothetical protein